MPGTRSGRPAPWLPRFAVAETHRNTSLLATVFLVLHVGLLLFDPYAQLKELADLHESGAVTDAEFATLKAQLLSNGTT